MAYTKAETWCSFDSQDIKVYCVCVCVCVWRYLMFTNMADVQSKHNYIYYSYRW